MMPNIAKYIGDGDRGASLRYMAAYALSAVSVLILVLIYCFCVIRGFGIESGWRNAAYSIMHSALRRFIMVFLPSVLFALLAGYYAKGTKRRLIFRSAQYVYWASALITFASALTVTLYVHDTASAPPLVSAETIWVSIDLNIITYIMILIPAFQMISAFLEYLGSRSEYEAAGT